MIHPSNIATETALTARGLAQRELHDHAMSATTEHFGNEVFVRGVIEVSNFCRENCSYCGMRRDNRSLSRYRADWKYLADRILSNRPACMTDLNLQAGEDPVAVREVVLPLLETLRHQTDLGLSVCLGTLDPVLYRELQEAGAEIYILKYETAAPELYKRFQAPGTQEERLRHIRRLAAEGWRVSSGFIAGLPGESMEQLLANFELATQLPLSGCSVSPFIPGEGTPLEDGSKAPIDLVLNAMAVLRLMRPDWVIPVVSALNLSQPGIGYGRGLMVGANLVTINLTPDDQRDDYVLYTRDRFLMTEERIMSALQAAGREPSRIGLAAHYRSAAVVEVGV